VCHCPPGMFDDDDGGVEDGAHARLLVPTPRASAASATGGGVCNPHTTPFTLIHPLLLLLSPLIRGNVFNLNINI
jgi:hypothetical protein